MAASTWRLQSFALVTGILMFANLPASSAQNTAVMNGTNFNGTASEQVGSIWGSNDRDSLPSRVQINELDKPISDAAKFNASVLKKIQRALEKNAETDIISILPTDYSSRLQDRKKDKGDDQSVTTSSVQPTSEQESPAPIRVPYGPFKIVHPMSSALKAMLNIQNIEPETPSELEMAQALGRVLRECEVLWRSNYSEIRYVERCEADMVVKTIGVDDNFTDYTSLQYLKEHKPDFPIPQPHGLITCNNCAYLFQSYISGLTLDKVWPSLDRAQKLSLGNDLNSLFLHLRQLPAPSGVALGGTGGKGCKDIRRHTRISEGLIHNIAEFWDFQYSGARAASPIYLEFLKRLTSSFQAQKIVFTHGDLRIENVMVKQGNNGNYVINGIIDWEMSGFYPEDFECTKITNTLAPNEKGDWFLYLPSCISLKQYPLNWLSDRIWDNYVV